MWRYILKRVLLIIPVILGISILIFGIIKMSPGDPARMVLGNRVEEEDLQQWRHEMGLDKPVVVQYFDYITKVLKGDFGVSYRTRRSVSEQLIQKFPITFNIALFSTIIAVIMGIPVGIISAVKRYSIFDGMSTILALIFCSMPSFWLALMLVLVFSLWIPIFPSNGISTWQCYILPSLATSVVTTPYLLRLTRNTLLEVMKEDYIRTARAKGLKERKIVMRHALKNTLIPVITAGGMQFGMLMGGAIITEQVFSIPGLGRYMIDGIRDHDIPIVMGSCLVVTIAFCLVNLVTDIAYAFLDPTIKAEYVRKA